MQISAGLRRDDMRVIAWAAVLLASAGVTGLTLDAAGYDLPPLWLLAGLALVAAVAERQSIRLTRTIVMSVSFLPFVFTAVAFGPLAAFAVGAFANIGDLRRPYMRWIVYTPARALTGAIAGLAAAVTPDNESAFLSILLASLVAAMANVVADATFNIGTGLARGSTTAGSFLRTIGPFLVVTLPLYVPVIALLVYGYVQYSIWAAATFLIPALALQRVIHLYQEQRDAAESLAAANARLERANISFAAALVATLDARDQYTAGHSAAVAIYSQDIARRMGLSEDDQKKAHLCGLVHDIGKIGLPAGLLEKPGALTLDERRNMQEHAEIGARILANVADYNDIAQIVRHHHERFDGRGYPDGLRGDAIPLLSRIIAVADAYNAMTSHRPYRDAMPSRIARLRLAQAVQTQFDTAVVAAFEAILAGADEAYRTGARADFTLSSQESGYATSSRASGLRAVGAA